MHKTNWNLMMYIYSNYEKDKVKFAASVNA